MKYTINNNTIDIEYIANGKRKTMKLNNNDPTDMDFFNQLIKAKSSKHDAMCDLYQRKILKPPGDNVVRIKPLKLVNEIKQSDYSKKQELQRRKQELQQDKQHIADEAKTLLKDEAKNKDITTLTKTDLNNESDYDKLKEIQSRYMEINKVQQLIINQIDSLDISTADSVNIKELKNLTVNAFDKINKSLVDAKITEKDKEDIIEKVTKLIVPRFDNLKTELETAQNNPGKIDEFIGYLTELSDALPKTDEIQNLMEYIWQLKDNIGDIPAVKETLSKIDDLITSLPDVFNDKTIQQRELDLTELVDALRDKQDILNSTITTELINKLETLPEIDPDTSDDQFREQIFGKYEQPNTRWKKYKPSTIQNNFPGLAFKYDDSLYVIGTKLPIEFKDERIWDIHFNKYSFEDISKLTVNDLINYTTLDYNTNIIIHHNPNIYIKTDIGIIKSIEQNYTNIQYPVFKLYKGDQNVIDLFRTIQKTIPKAKGLSESNDVSGKIMIDLDKSNIDEKLNEVIRLLSQMNYNVFTTTPMYKDLRSSASPVGRLTATRKNNRYKTKTETKKSKGLYTDSSDDSTDESNPSKVDLYKIFDL